MDIKVKVEGLIEALLLVGKAIDVKATESTSSMVYIRAIVGWLFLYSTNSSSEVFVKMPADVKTAGECMIDPAKLRNGLSNPPNETVRIFKEEKENSWVTATCGRSRFRLPIRIETLVVADHIKSRYPLKKEASIKLPADLLRSFYSRAGFCVFEGEHRMSSIKGIRIEKNDDSLSVWATDSRIACNLQIKINDKAAVVDITEAISIEGEQFSKINAILSKKKEELIDVIIDSPWIYFRMGDVIYSTRMLAGSYPAISTMFSSHPKKTGIRIEVQPLLNALKRFPFFLQESERGAIMLRVTDGKLLEISCSQMKEEFEVQADGLPPVYQVKIMLDQLTNILSASTSSHINLYPNEEKKPIMFEDHASNTSHDISVEYILMGV